VDPYYLAHKAKSIGHKPKMILSGRAINNFMPKYVVKNLIDGMKRKKIKVKNSKILILGLTFKENCSDTRNSKIFEIISNLNKNKINVYVHDPWVQDRFVEEKNFKFLDKIINLKFDAVLLAVAHDKFKKISINTLKSVCKKRFFLYDLKNYFESNLVDLKL
jgi:UDP-N-acetyl-D-mannosaminuronate dehydrogenase